MEQLAVLTQPRGNPWPKGETAIDHADSFLCVADEFNPGDERQIALLIDCLHSFAIKGLRSLPCIKSDEAYEVRQQIRGLSQGFRKLSIKPIPEDKECCPKVTPNDVKALESIGTKCAAMRVQCRTFVNRARTVFNDIHKDDMGDENKENEAPCNMPVSETSDEDDGQPRIDQKSWNLLSKEEHEGVFDRMEQDAIW
ncbi:hypothetical protein BKA93DRAFT_826253 [Sparassis latifolia]